MTGYVVVFGIALLARLILSVLPFEFVTPQQAMVWSWPFFGVLILCFWSGVFFAQRAQLPSPNEVLRSRSHWVSAIVTGTGVGLLIIWLDIISPAAAGRGLAKLHVDGIVSLPFYIYGAIVLSVVFHFLPISLTAWLAGRVDNLSKIFVITAGVIIVAFSEDFTYFTKGPVLLTIESGRHILSVIANAIEGWLIYRYGLLSGLLQRGTIYLLWHIVWPNLSRF